MSLLTDRILSCCFVKTYFTLITALSYLFGVSGNSVFPGSGIMSAVLYGSRYTSSISTFHSGYSRVIVIRDAITFGHSRACEATARPYYWKIRGKHALIGNRSFTWNRQWSMTSARVSRKVSAADWQYCQRSNWDCSWRAERAINWKDHRTGGFCGTGRSWMSISIRIDVTLFTVTFAGSTRSCMCCVRVRNAEVSRRLTRTSADVANDRPGSRKIERPLASIRRAPFLKSARTFSSRTTSPPRTNTRVHHGIKHNILRRRCGRLRLLFR